MTHAATASRRRRAVLLPAALLLMTGAGALVARQAPEGAAPAAPALVHQRQPEPGLITGGVPETSTVWEALARSGVRLVIDLRADQEVGRDELAAIAAAGLRREVVTVTGEAELDLPTARALDALLDAAEGSPTAIVCSSGNRVGALLAVEGFWLDGLSAEAALERGLAAGMTRLEPSVRQLLGLPPAPPPPAD